MDLIGTIIRLQVQTASLKTGEKPNRIYDPSPLQTVPALRISPEGVIGVTDDGSEIIDVHHIHHPATRNSAGSNGISFNFAAHYDQMQAHAGDHLIPGCAGENVLIAGVNGGQVTLADLDERLIIISVSTGDQIELLRVMVAAPCVEFSRFALQRQDADAAAIREILQFLDHGRRGFYATPDAASIIRPGDRLYRPTD